MRIIIPIVTILILASCSAPKAVVEQQRSEIIKCDTVGAKLSANLRIKLNDIVIIPPDSTRARVLIKSVELKEQHSSELIAESHHQLSTLTQSKETKQHQPPKFLLYLIITLLLYLLITRK